jgi:hypothetical protein
VDASLLSRSIASTPENVKERIEKVTFPSHYFASTSLIYPSAVNQKISGGVVYERIPRTANVWVQSYCRSDFKS